MRAAYDPTWRNLRAWFSPRLDRTSWWDEEYVSDPSGGVATPTLTGHTEGDSGTGASTYDLTITIPSGQSLLVVDQGFVPTVNPTSVTLDPAGLNLALTTAGAKVTSSATSTGRGLQRYYLINPPAGTFTLRGVLSGVVLQTLDASWWTNTDTTAPLGTQVSSSGTTGTSRSIATGGVPFFFGALGLRSTTAPTADAGQTAVSSHQSSTNQQWYTSYKTSGGSFGYTWSTSDESVLLGHEIVGAAASSISQAINPATESDAAQALGRAKVRALGTAVETETPIALGRKKARLAGIAAETDTLVSPGRLKTRLTGITAETDASITYGRLKVKALGIATETDTALATPRKTGLTGPLNPAAETDAAIAVGRKKVRALGIATETDSAITLGRVRSRALGIATETEAPQPLGRRKTKAALIPLETDASLALARTKLRTTGIAAETDASLAFARSKALALAGATETDTAVALGAVLGLQPVFDAIGTVQALTTTANVPYPAGLTNKHFIVLFVESGDSTITSGTPAGFTAASVNPHSGGGVNELRAYTKQATGSESGTITVTTAAGTKGRAWMASYVAPFGRSTSLALAATAVETTSDTSVAPVSASITTVSGTDTIVALAVGAGDFSAGAFTGFNLTQSGAALGTLGTRHAGRTGTNTQQTFHLDKRVVTGATGAVTATGTGNAATATGAAIILVLRSSVGSAQVLALGTATETDAGQPLGRVRSRLLGIPLYAGGWGEGGYGDGGYGSGLSASDQAMPMTRIDPTFLNPPIENDTALPLARTKRRTLGTALEVDQAQHLAHGIIRALGTAVEVDLALGLTVRSSEILVRIARSALPQPVDALVDIGGYGGTSRFQRALRRGSVVQRALLLTPPSVEHPNGLVVATTDPSVVARWDAGAVILDPAGIVLDNQSWQAKVLAANGYTLEAAP